MDLGRSRPYRTDSCSLRATGGSPPSASLDDINSDEHKQEIAAQVTDWLSSVEEPVSSTSPYGLHTGPATTDIHPVSNAFRLGEYYSDRRWQDDSKWPQETSGTIDVGPKYKTVMVGRGATTVVRLAPGQDPGDKLYAIKVFQSCKLCNPYTKLNPIPLSSTPFYRK